MRARVAAGIAALTLGAGHAGAAHAAVDIGGERIVVTGEGARATITRAPLRIEVADGAGRTVLAQVPNDRPAPAVAPTLDPEPSGTDNLPDGSLYAPFVFEVGGERNLQFPATSWVGNNLLGGRGGVQYSARDVKAARPTDKGGVELVVATNDPSGRELVVTVDPDRPGALRIAARVTPTDGVSSLGDSFASGPDEAFRGFGGRHNALDQRGSSFINWTEEENFGAGPLAPVGDNLPNGGGKGYLFPNGKTAAYYVQSLFYSSRPYGFLLDRDELSRWRMASTRPDAWSVSVAAPAIDYVVAPGEARTAMGTLTAINGRHRVPPEFSQGPTLYRGVRVLSAGADTPASYVAKVRDDIAQIDRARLPVSAYAIEGWDFIPRADLKQLVAELTRRDIRVLFYFRSYVSQDAGQTERGGLFEEAVQKGYLAKTPGGAPFLYGSSFIAGVAGLIDFTNPDARRWWEGRVREALDLGADGFMEDFGEQVQVDMRFADGSTGAQMHNRYPVIYHRTTREVVDRWEAEHPDRPGVFFFTRAGYSGSPGSAAYEGGNFPGDETTDFNRASGLPSILPDMLNRAVGGAVGYTTDIGGYADYITGPVTEELFVRWSEASALMPFFRVHNSSSGGVKMPWAFGPRALEQWRSLAQLHQRALPLIRRLWQESARTGVPPTRPLWLAAPGDPTAARQEEEFMLGDDVLVAPVVEQGATGRDVYFPAGCWERPETRERFAGQSTARVRAGLGELPYFFRCGKDAFAIPKARRCKSKRVFWIRLREPRGRDRLVRARVTVNGRRVRVKRIRGRLRAKVDLRGRPREESVVRIVARTKQGRTLRGTRRYHPCVSKRLKSKRRKHR
ncbi:MAG TPA: TIM-barrel domain-containing protein [Solirubrobacteraceae bacterium]|jgi:alpha-D-xyloside xylohydrolase